MKIEKLHVTIIDWDVPLADEDDFDECVESGSIKPSYVVELVEGEDPAVAIPQQISKLSGWTPISWNVRPPRNTPA
jgi:hypothetical protein